MATTAHITNLLMTTPKDVNGVAYERGAMRSPVNTLLSNGYFTEVGWLGSRLNAGFSLQDLVGDNKFDQHYLHTYQPDLYIEAEKKHYLHNNQPLKPVDITLTTEMARNVGVHVDGNVLSAEQLIDAKVNLIEAMQAATEKATGKIHLLNANDFDIHVSGGLVGNVDNTNLKSLIVDQYSAQSRFSLQQGPGNTLVFVPTNQLIEFDGRGARLTLSMDEVIQATTEKFQRRVPADDFNKMLQSVTDAQLSHVANASSWSPESLEIHAQKNIRVMTSPDVSLMGERLALDHITGKSRIDLSGNLLFEELRSTEAKQRVAMQTSSGGRESFIATHEHPDVLDIRGVRGALSNTPNLAINLDPYGTPITDVELKKIASTTSPTQSNGIGISSQQVNLDPYRTPITDADLKKAAHINFNGKGGLALLVGSGLALASGVASAYVAEGGFEEKADAFMKTTGEAATDMTPVVSATKSAHDDKPNEAIARLVDWTPAGEENRYLQRLAAFVTGKTTDIEPGMVESFGTSALGSLKYMAIKTNEMINSAQKAMGTPSPLAPNEEFMKLASNIVQSGDANVKVPDYKPIELRAAVANFADTYKKLASDGSINDADKVALNFAINTIYKAFDSNGLGGIVAKYEDNHVNQAQAPIDNYHEQAMSN